MPQLIKTLAAATLATMAATSVANDVMLQYYESKWETIEKKLPDIFAAGYQAFWFPPPSKADTGGFSVGYDVFDRFNLGKPFDQTLYGTETGVRQMVKAAHLAGMNVYFDYVPNHNGFRDSSTPGFVAGGDYPGFVTTLPGDVDGDFHSSFSGSVLEMRLAGLIDIAQEKNHQFIRQPVGPNALNIPNETPNAENAKFYPDLQLPANSEGIHPFNQANPLAGDAVQENATGLLLRNAQWMIESVGADGFRIDAMKHVPTWFFNNFFDRTVYQRVPNRITGGKSTAFSFGEIFDGDFGLLSSYRRKDGYGNREVLDFPLHFKMNSVLNGTGLGDMRELEFASFDAVDGNANDGSAGVPFVASHDEGGPALDNVAYAHILTRPGYPIVYFNALEFGTGRDFPKGGRGDALGGDFGNLIPRLVDVSRRYAKGSHFTRWIDADTYVYERSNSLLVGLSDRTDAGFDSRTVTTDFRNVTLTELSGAASDPVVNANGDFPQTITIGNDGVATIRVPRNRTNSTQHSRGFIMYGMPTPTQTQTVSPAAGVLPAESNSVPNGSRRHTPVQVVTANNFTINVQTSATGTLDDNALVRLDGGVDFDGTPGLFISSGEFAGFEQFTAGASPRFTGGTGNYSVNVNATNLSEGMHFIETVAFTNRTSGPSAYSSERKTIYLDRVPPPVSLVFPGNTGNGDVRSQSYGVVVRCPDATANSMHIFIDQPPGYDFLGNVNGSNLMTKVDRNEFRYTWNNITNGNHSLTIVAFEPTGNSSVTRYENVHAIVPAPNMAFGEDTDQGSSSVNFQPLPTTINTRMYNNEFVIRVDTTGATGTLVFPQDYTVTLNVDGTTYTAQAYNASLLPPVNMLVQNDQNLGDNFDEFRFLWRGYTRGLHNLEARAQLTAGSSVPNSISAIINVPEDVTGPPLLINSPTAGANLNQPTSVTVNLTYTGGARSAQAFISQPGGGQPWMLLDQVNLGTGNNVTLSRAVSNHLVTDNLTGLSLQNGQYTIRAVVGTGLDGGGITNEATTTISVTGFPTAPPSPITPPVVDGNLQEFFSGPAALAISPTANGAGPDGADFGADGSLTEFHARVVNNSLYLAVRGDMFNGSDPNSNATIIYIDTDSTSGTGAKLMAVPSNLSDTGNGLKGVVTNSGFNLSGALQSQGVGFDAAVVITGTSPLSYGLYGFGSGGVNGSTSSFADLTGSLAFGRGMGSAPAAAGTAIAGPSGFEVVIPLSQLGNANPRTMAFAVVTTSDSSFPSPNTLPENASTDFTSVQTIDGVAKFPVYPLVINEVNNGANDWIEIHNKSAQAVSLSSWTLQWTDASGNFAILPLNGGNAGANAYIVVSESTLSPTPPAGSVVLNSNLPWSPDRAASAAIVDPYGLAADYVAWTNLSNQPATSLVPPGTYFSGSARGADGASNQTVARNPASTDTDQGSDWAVRAATPGAINPAETRITDWMIYR